jgi:predicted site-specific integrase-resolvase
MNLKLIEVCKNVAFALNMVRKGMLTESLQFKVNQKKILILYKNNKIISWLYSPVAFS